MGLFDIFSFEKQKALKEAEICRQNALCIVPLKKTSSNRTGVLIKGDIQMNETTKLTQDEAEQLLKMLKDALTNHIVFPEKGDSIEFDVQGTTKKDLFTIKIYRGSINKSKYDIGARIKKNNIHLLELHISENKVHYNPDGTKIIGSHWHVYSEEYGRKFSFPAENIESAKFVENTVMFLDEFHVIQKPEISFQLEIV